VKDTIEQLPRLRRMILPALLTFKRKQELTIDPFNQSNTYGIPEIDTGQLYQYLQFFGREANDYVPLCFLYLMAQRAQLAMMTRSKFPLPVPGLIHLENELESFREVQFSTSFQLIAHTSLSTTSEGSFIVQFTVEIQQDGGKVAVCKSKYLYKVASSGNKRHKKDWPIEKWEDCLDVMWQIPINIGWKYAKVSGDYNMIHYSSLLAKSFGFPRSIAHGWYVVGKAVLDMERRAKMSSKYIYALFKKPVLTNSKVHVQFKVSDDENHFRVLSGNGEKLLVEGFAR